MKREQMDLFPQVTAEILSFPIYREVGRVREMARQLDRRSGRSADAHWNAECDRLAARLEGLGMDAGQVRAEIDRFARAVSVEMNREPVSRYGGGDAA